MIGKAAKYNTIPLLFAAVQSPSQSYYILNSFIILACSFIICVVIFVWYEYCHLYRGKQSTSIGVLLLFFMCNISELMSLYILFSLFVNFLQRTFLFSCCFGSMLHLIFAIVLKNEALSVLFFPLCLICI